MEVSMEMKRMKDDIQIPVALDYTICITYEARLDRDGKVLRPCQAMCLCTTLFGTNHTPYTSASPATQPRLH